LDSCDAFLLDQIKSSISRRSQNWSRDFSSAEGFVKSIEPNREKLAELIGMKDDRLAYESPQIFDLVGEGPGYTIYRVRWPVIGQVYGHGLLVIPEDGAKDKMTVVIPDADQRPEQILGLTGALEPNFQLARTYAEKGGYVLIPDLIDRTAWRDNISHREYIYRSAFALGRHMIGYEVQKILAGVDWFQKSNAHHITVVGYGEGGLLAFYAGAIDTRITETVVGGYYGSRQSIWEEPAERNIFGLLSDFGDAEIATLIAPRKLTIIVDLPVPAVNVLPGGRGKPALIHSIGEEELDSEIRRAEQFVAGLSWEISKISSPIPSMKIPKGSNTGDLNASTRQSQMVMELDHHNQSLLVESPYVRQEFMKDLDFTNLTAYRTSTVEYRQYFERQIIGKFDIELDSFNTRSRSIDVGSDEVRAYEVVLDVFEGVFAYGLILIPKDLKVGESRPAIVCQHGLEGRPQSTVGEMGYKAYKAFSTQLAERGYIVFAPQNLYIFKDRFRTLQFKANAIQKTLFSLMVPQHQQITDWLAQLDMVDAERIAFYGLSYGGKSAMRIPALVSNYCLSICSADFNDWVWKVSSSRSPYSYVGTGEYEIFEWDLGSTFNYAEMAALIAPRPFMVERGHFDGVAPDERVAYEYAKVRHLYNALLKIPDRTRIEWFVGPHTINGKGTFEFLDSHLDFNPVKH
jgi:dienelactone hydrolase